MLTREKNSVHGPVHVSHEASCKNLSTAGSIVVMMIDPLVCHIKKLAPARPALVAARASDNYFASVMV